MIKHFVAKETNVKVPLGISAGQIQITFFTEFYKKKLMLTMFQLSSARPEMIALNLFFKNK